ncbi:MAG: SDR family oxidoreductase [Bryobacterales bacterium]|nr:SDR family oxidoreductase [Bryobacteraceae bacterium]MDW8129876.1 SDR family oxidoreductase [Bryobacterales bacterium]
MAQTWHSLEGRTALVAGASRGIGLAIAREMARAGAHTILAARSLDKLEAEAARLREQGFLAEALRLDISDRDSIEAAVRAAPPVDVLVVVSGINLRKPFLEYTRQEYEALLRTNLDGPVELVRAVGRGMIERGRGGRIILIGSMMTILGLPYLVPYALAKSALGGLTRVLAAEWAPYSIQVNAILPGFILTDLTRPIWERPEMLAWMRGVVPAGRLGTPEEIAPLAVFLAGPGAGYITGQLIAVDGGYSTCSVWPLKPA